MSEENNNFDVARQQEAEQAAEKLQAEQDQAIENMNKEKAEQDAEEARRQQEIQQEADAYGEAAREKPQVNFDDNNGNMNFSMSPDNPEVQNGTPSETLATATPSSEEIKNYTNRATANRVPTPNPTDASNTQTAPSTSETNTQTNSNGGNGGNNEGNNGLDTNNLGATAGDQAKQSPEDKLEGVYSTEEMFRARYVAQPFYLSDRFKNTWKECMAGFNNAKDPAEAIEQLFWGFVNLAPKMIIAYTFHLEDQEIERKRAAQHDKEEYDKQILLMKGISPIEFHKHKCDWVFGSEELHKYLNEQQENLPKDEYGYVDITKCDDHQKKQVRNHVENFIKHHPHYKTMIENFTHREFAQDELNREAAGMAAAVFHMQGKPDVVTRNGKPIDMGPTDEPTPPTPPTNGPDRPTPPNGPQNPTNGPDRPTPPNGPQGPAPKGPQGPKNPEGPTPPTPPKNVGLDTLLQGQKQRRQGQVRTTGSLKNARPIDTTALYNQARAASQNMSGTLNAININRTKGAMINRARSGVPAYGQQRTGYEYAQQNMGHVA